MGQQWASPCGAHLVFEWASPSDCKSHGPTVVHTNPGRDLEGLAIWPQWLLVCKPVCSTGFDWDHYLRGAQGGRPVPHMWLACPAFCTTITAPQLLGFLHHNTAKVPLSYLANVPPLAWLPRLKNPASAPGKTPLTGARESRLLRER